MRRFAGAVERRTGLQAPALVWLAAGLAMLVGASAVFGHLIEQVTAGQGRFVAGDPRHLQWFTSLRSGMIGGAARQITALGAVSVLVQIALVAAGVLWWRRARLALAVAPLVALLVAGSTTLLIKNAFPRQGPTDRWHTWTGPSFPSGHAADSSALYVALALVAARVLLHRPLGRLFVLIAGFGFPGVIGLSRLVLGVHWPTDVLAGWALGSAIAIVVVVLAVAASGGAVRRVDDPGEPATGAGRRSRAVRAITSR